MLQDIVDNLVILAEDLYGSKIGNYPIKISEIKECHITPHIEIVDDTIKICITDKAYNQFSEGNEIHAVNQIAHEVIHSLMQPQAHGNSNYLEEGVAIYFSVVILVHYKLIEEMNTIINDFKENNYKYYQALNLIIKSGIDEEIKNIRIKKPFLAEVEYNDLNDLVIDENIKRLLLTNFQEEIDF